MEAAMASPHDLAVCIKDAQGRFKIRVKVTPGSKRTKITGLLGDRLKIAVTARPKPAEPITPSAP